MSDKGFQMFNKSNFFIIAFSFLMLVNAGCSSSLLSGSEPTSAPPQTEIKPEPMPIVVNGVRASYADVVEKTSPAVVNISAERKAQPQQFPFGEDDFFRQLPIPVPRQNQPPQVERGLGSGVIVSADGTILTNHHVIDGADKIRVDLKDGKSYEAKVVGSDPPSDLAVLKIEAQTLPFLTPGNSDNVRVGDIILAIGNPLGIGQTVTAGIVSAKGRQTGLSDGSFEDFLQIDAPINRGNSGGALVNLNGELIGINSQILSTSGGNIGIGFAIPSNMAKTVLDQLVANGKVRRGLLGVGIQNITEDLAQGLGLRDTKGILVTSVKPGSAADKAGIKRGDVITAVNGEGVEESNVLRNKIAGTIPGSEVAITIIRDGQEQQVKVILDEFESEGVKPNNQQQPGNNNQPESSQQGKLGLSLQTLTPDIAQRLNLPGDTKGVVVTDVDSRGAAASKGVTRGDVILEINRIKIETVEDVESVLANSADKPLVLVVLRDGQTFYVTVKSN